MQELEITYYYDFQSREIHPVMGRKNPKSIVSYIHYYLSLLESGFLYEDLLEKLQEAFHYHYEIGGHKKYLDPILKQIDYLTLAYQEYLKKDKLQKKRIVLKKQFFFFGKNIEKSFLFMLEYRQQSRRVILDEEGY